MSSFNRIKSDKLNLTDGIYLQYSVKHNKSVESFSIRNGKIDENRYIAQRRIVTLKNDSESRVYARLPNSYGKLMSGHNPACDPVYLIIWDKLTGKLLSQTWLYDDCAEEDGSEPYEPSTPNDPEQDPCENAGDALNYEIAGENNLIQLENEVSTSRSMIYRWIFLKNTLGLWSYMSTERGFHKKVDGEWQWDRIEHLGEGLEGITPATDITVSNFVLQPVIGKYYLTGKAYFNFKAKILCDSKFNPIPGVNANLTATCEVWYVNDIFE